MMLKKSILWLLCPFVVSISFVVACGTEAPNPVVNSNPQFTIIDANWPNTLSYDASFRGPTLSIKTSLEPLSMVSPNLVHAFDDSPTDYSPAEQFAIDLIRERTKKLIAYHKAFIHYPMHLANVYLRSSPKVYANKAIGEEMPGTDLSSLFSISGPFAKMLGPDYTIADGRDFRDVPMSDYFTTGAMMPMEFILSSNLIAEYARGVDFDINLQFIFPVTIEHYWSWLLELYENSDVEESFTEAEIVLEINLKDVRRIG
ncbi:MAG: hypothetical protein IKS71_02780 [Bacteroidales bacterium]|nr:hypothetical protein [Bacteroidales bacterium]